MLKRRLEWVNVLNATPSGMAEVGRAATGETTVGAAVASGRMG